jgi:hypothetical protein
MHRNGITLSTGVDKIKSMQEKSFCSIYETEAFNKK